MKNKRIGVPIKKLGEIRGLSTRRIRTTTIDSRYTDWVGERLPTHEYELAHGFPFVEEEIKDSDEEADEDGESDEDDDGESEEEEGDEEDESSDMPMMDAPILPSAHFERGGPSGGQESYDEQFQSINERLGRLQTSFDGFRGTMKTRMAEMYEMQTRMYYHSMGTYYDPSAPFPPPPPQ